MGPVLISENRLETSEDWRDLSPMSPDYLWKSPCYSTQNQFRRALVTLRLTSTSSSCLDFAIPCELFLTVPLGASVTFSSP